jgi:hypothetical protein
MDIVSVQSGGVIDHINAIFRLINSKYNLIVSKQSKQILFEVISKLNQVIPLLPVNLELLNFGFPLDFMWCCVAEAQRNKMSNHLNFSNHFMFSVSLGQSIQTLKSMINRKIIREDGIGIFERNSITLEELITKTKIVVEAPLNSYSIVFAEDGWDTLANYLMQLLAGGFLGKQMVKDFFVDADMIDLTPRALDEITRIMELRALYDNNFITQYSIFIK